MLMVYVCAISYVLIRNIQVPLRSEDTVIVVTEIYIAYFSVQNKLNY